MKQRDVGKDKEIFKSERREQRKLLEETYAKRQKRRKIAEYIEPMELMRA